MNETISNPLVSVVLATYNGEKYLETQLQSVFNQTYPNLEVIVVDDRSNDNTLLLLNQYEQKHQNLKVYVNEKNLGFIKNFEKGCRLSKGDFIALCDQDDYWHPDKIKIMVEAIGEHPMIYCDSILCNQNLEDTGTRISDRVVCQPIVNSLQQVVFCRIYGHATLFTRALFEKAYPFLDVIPHDWWLAYVASLQGEIKYLDQPLVHYRQHANNLYGAVGGKRRKKESRESVLHKKRKEITQIRTRIHAFLEACPPHLEKEKKVLSHLAKGYKNFSPYNNLLRMYLFFRYQKFLLAVKKRSPVRKHLFCLKMFVMIK